MNTSKIIKGVVGGGRYAVTSPIVKEDYGLYLQIEGIELPDTYEVDFSNDEHSGSSVTMIGNADGVLIPSQFIKSGKDVFAFLYHVGADYGRTVYKFRIPNKLRPDRTDEEPTPEEQSVIDQTIAALNSAVEKTAQDVIDADASAQSASESAISASESATSAQQSLTALTEYGDQAIRELTRIEDEVNASASRAEDSAQASAQSAQSASQSAQDAQDALEEFTTPTASATTLPEGSNATASYSNGNFAFGIPRGDKGERGERGLQGIQGERGLQGETGASGRDGTDGISPTVSITPITGGHRITITDADGEHSADVMDGTTPDLTDYVQFTDLATTTKAGAMSAQDKGRLDSVYDDYSSALTALGVI